ncbi:hypothetical protein [Thauera humireducens]|uniref:hypothetical protein n=1 Tax=Thauera humireducens TaxID=1134435 RepID=UPI0012E86672|nr:hypothetical protein [Thauera humireducens]
MAISQFTRYQALRRIFGPSAFDRSELRNQKSNYHPSLGFYSKFGKTPAVFEQCRDQRQGGAA